MLVKNATEQSVDELKALAERACAAYDYEAAIRHFSRALASLRADAQASGADAATEFDLLARRAECYEWIDDSEAEQADLQEMARLAGEHDDLRWRVTVVMRWALIMPQLSQAERERVAEDAEAAAAHARLSGDPRIEADGLTALAEVRYRLTDTARASILYEQALRLYRDLGDRAGQALNLSRLGRIAIVNGHLAQAQDFLESALALLAQQAAAAIENARLVEETRRANRELGRRVAERTAELARANERLQREAAERGRIGETLRRQNEYLAALYDTTIGLIGRLDLNELLKAIVARAGQLMNAPHGYIYLLDPATETIDLKLGRGAFEREVGDRLKPGEGLAGKVWQSGQPMMIDEYDTWPGRDPRMEYGVIRALMGAPLTMGAQAAGVLGIAYGIESARTFGHDELDLLGRFAQLASVALDNARLYATAQQELAERQRADEILRRQNAYLAALHDTTLGLISRLDLRDLLEAIILRAGQLLGTPHGFIYLVSPDGTELQRQVGVGIFTENRAPRLKPGEGLSGKVWESGQAIVVNDYDSWPGRSPVGVSLVDAMAGMPLLSGAKVAGVIALASERGSGRTFGEEEIELLTRFAQLAAIALDNARLHAETERRLKEQIALRDASIAVSSTLDLKTLLSVLTEQIGRVIDATSAYISTYDPETRVATVVAEYLSPQACDEERASDLGAAYDMPRDRPGIVELLETGRAITAHADDETVSEADRMLMRKYGAQSILFIALRAGGQLIGFVEMWESRRRREFTPEEIALSEGIAQQTAIAIQNARLFEEMQRARVAADAANASKSEFLSNVSHELRTPMTSVLGFTRLIQKRLEDVILKKVQADDEKTQKAIGQMRENLGIIITEGVRLTALINDVLDLAKIEAGKVVWERDRVSIADVVDRAVAATEALLAQKRLSLVQDIAAGLPDALGDRDRLIQVMINLLSNAIKFTDRGTVTCQVRLAGGEIVVSVADTGVGIVRADQAAIFEKFKQAGSTLTDKPKGTGLGLAICREIVNHHGGRIWVESEPGKRSTFSFTLPVRSQT